MIKLFGVGNILLCDDAVGVRVVERLMPYLNALSPTVQTFIGETDCFYCLDCIAPDDFVIIVDSTYLDLLPGTVSFFSFSECSPFLTASNSAHEMTLLKMLRLEHPEIEGCLIGIEINKIDFSLELSSILQVKLQDICEEILQYLKKAVRSHV